MIDLTGKKFGRLTVTSLHSKNKYHTLKWNCVCECGKEVIVFGFCLKNGNTKSCGCITRTHNESNRTKEYRAWVHIKDRCNNPNDKGYKNYGSRGITVCDRWINSYENFLADMGRAPTPQHSIERKENNKGYSPDNCKWATKIEQANNVRNNRVIEYQFRVQTLAQWCRELKVDYRLIHNRIYALQWTFDCAVTVP